MRLHMLDAVPAFRLCKIEHSRRETILVAGKSVACDGEGTSGAFVIGPLDGLGIGGEMKPKLRRGGVGARFRHETGQRRTLGPWM